MSLFQFLEGVDVNSLGFKAGRRYISDAIEIALTENWTQTYTNTSLRAFGFRFDNTWFNRKFRELRDFRVSFEYPTSLDPDEKPDIFRMATSPHLEQGKFWYTGKVEGYNAETDTWETQYWRFRTSDIWSQNDFNSYLEEWGIPKSVDLYSEYQNYQYIGAIRGIK